jgi:hypothetical protein
MTPEIASLLVLALVIVVLLFALRGKDKQTTQILQAQDLERAAWASERRELNTRIQHPHVFIPDRPPAAPTESAAEEEADESALVGQVVVG